MNIKVAAFTVREKSSNTNNNQVNTKWKIMYYVYHVNNPLVHLINEGMVKPV